VANIVTKGLSDKPFVNLCWKMWLYGEFSHLEGSVEVYVRVSPHM
jgi:hypothetical protein